MKRHVLTIIGILSFLSMTAQNYSWTQKANFSGNSLDNASSFVIKGKGYICTGNKNYGNTDECWAYDTATGAWTQKADFGGSARHGGVGFSINGKGYVGLGKTVWYNSGFKDFWEL